MYIVYMFVDNVRDEVATGADAVHGCASSIYTLCSSIVSPGMSVSFPVTLVPARLALSWSPGPAHVEEQNTRSATVIVHEVLFAPRTFVCNCTCVFSVAILTPREI